MKITLQIFFIAIITYSCTVTENSFNKDLIQKPRTIIITDGKIDDIDSFIRMILYANEFQNEGLIYSSSMWPAYPHLIDVGLHNLDHPDWGGWGGRLVHSTKHANRWENGEEVMDFNLFTGKMNPTFPQIRWIEAIPEDFAGHADWCIKEFENANHPPKIKPLNPIQFKAYAGASFEMAIEATDPDDDKIEVNYWIYKEAGNYTDEVNLVHTGNKLKVDLTANEIGTQHIIASVKDKTSHLITKYQRFVIDVRQKNLKP